MIQFLNIAGLGPIFGAIMGAQFGTGSYLWIVFGTIFGGAVHDFFVGTISLRNGGESLPQIVGRYLGHRVKTLMCLFTIALLVLVAAVWVAGPAEILGRMTEGYVSVMAWIVIIFLYYVLATMLPIDKIIGKVYPVFAFILLASITTTQENAILELSDIENKLAAVRRFFNSATRELNNAVQTFPGNLLAGMFGFHTEKMYEIEASQRAAMDKAPEISF